MRRATIGKRTRAWQEAGRGPRLFGCLLALLFSGQGCHDNGEHRHDHSNAHPAGHDHHAPHHGHGDRPVISFTRWSDQLELFGEHVPGVVGQESSFLLHLTRLADFQAVPATRLTLTFEGPAPLRAETSRAVRAGIFRMTVKPTVAGTYTGTLDVEGEGAVDGITFEVVPDRSTVPAGKHHTDDHNDDHDHDHGYDDGHGDDVGLIEFLKEQQWGVPFGTAFVEEGTLVPAFEVAGRVGTPPGGQAEVSAPVTGRLIAPAGGLPRPGDHVKRGRVLAALLPTPSSPEGAAAAQLAVTEAEARHAAARLALSRAEQLIKDEAIPQRQLEDARRELSVATEAVQAAERASQLYTDVGGGGQRGAWQLKAPISGTLVSVRATPGATVAPGAPLFRLVDDRELWIIARVPEQDAAHLASDRDASFQLAGDDRWQPITITGEDATASLVTVGRAVDPHTRTVDVIYALREPPEALRVGGLVRVSLPSGKPYAGVVIPSSALIDQEGRDVVYVQADGEHFEERLVRVGPRAGARVAIESGLQAGERIVTRGAHLVRLADRAKGGEAHGHIH